MKTILITGVSGLLGSNLAYILKNKFQIVGVDVQPFFMNDVLFYQLDITIGDKFENICDETCPDVILHCAAAIDVDACEVNPDMAYKANVELTQKVVNVAKSHKADFVYISTDSVFDGTCERLYSEQDPVSPINIYGKSKAEGEKIALLYYKSLVLRTNIYGFNWLDKQSFGEWILESLKDNKELNMFTDIFYSPILVNDMADVIETALLHKLRGIFNACSNGSISKYEFGKSLQNVFGIENGIITPISADKFNFIAKRPRNMGMDSSLFTEKTGYIFKTPYESIKEFYKLWSLEYPKLLKERTT